MRLRQAKKIYNNIKHKSVMSVKEVPYKIPTMLTAFDRILKAEGINLQKISYEINLINRQTNEELAS